MTGRVEEDVLGFEIPEQKRRQNDSNQLSTTSNTNSNNRGTKGKPENSPVDDIVLVQMLQRQHQLSDVKPRPLLREPPLLLKMPEQLASTLVVRNEVELLLRLEAELESDEERAFEGGLKDLPFSDGVSDLLLGYNLLLGEDLHGVDSLGVSFPNLEDSSERSSTDELEELEVPRGKVSLALLEGKKRRDGEMRVSL